MVLYVLLETDAVPKWAGVLGLRFFKYQEFKDKQGLFGDMKYKNFLASSYPNFFIYLLTCQECLCVWLNIIGFIFFPQALSGWGFFGITTIGSLIAIATLNRLLRKLYE